MSTIDEIKEEFEHAVKLGRKNRGNIVGLLFAEIDRLTKENTDLTVSLKKAEVVICLTQKKDIEQEYLQKLEEECESEDMFQSQIRRVGGLQISLDEAIADYRKEKPCR